MIQRACWVVGLAAVIVDSDHDIADVWLKQCQDAIVKVGREMSSDEVDGTPSESGWVGTVDVPMSAGEIDGTPWYQIEHFLKLRGFVRRQAGHDVVFVKCEHLHEFCSGLSDLPARSRTIALQRFNKARGENLHHQVGGGGECDAGSFVEL